MRGKLDVSNSPIEKMKLHNRKKMIKDILTKIVLVLVFGLGGFYGGIYYGTNKFNNMMDKLYADYVFIKNDVDAFVKVSNPETIRHYVKELNKILDDITFLGKMVESGQLADEALTGFFKTYQKQLDDVNRRLIELYVEVAGSVEQLKEQNNIQYSDIKDNLDLIDSVGTRLKEQIDYVNKLNVDVGQSINNLEDDIQTIKSSKYGKKIWIVKK